MRTGAGMKICLTLRTFILFPFKALITMVLHKVFVYGSLKKRQTQKDLFGLQPPVFSKAVLKDWVFIKNKEYPYIKPSESKTVEGVVLHLSTEQLEQADRWEEVPEVYQREKVTVRTTDGSFFNVWTYTRRNAE